MKEKLQLNSSSSSSLGPVSFLNVTANMAGDPNATVTDNTQLHASLPSQVGHSTLGSSTPALLLSQFCPLLMQPTTAKTLISVLQHSS